MEILKIENTASYQKERYKALVCALLSLMFITVFVTFVLHYRNSGSWSIDNPVYRFLQTFRSKPVDNIFIIVTSMGNTISVILWTMIVFIVLMIKKKHLDAFYFAAIIVGAWILNDSAKAIIKRARPTHEWLVHATNYSFPSGHSMIFMSFSLLLIFFMFRLIMNKKIVWTASMLLFILAVSVGISRVYVGVHFISDVLGGWSFGSFWVFANLSVLFWLRSRKLRMNL